MTGSLVAACIWAILAAITAMLPLHRQYPPGITLLALSPIILFWLLLDHGPITALVAGTAFVSMFRRPLVHLGKKALGLMATAPAVGQGIGHSAEEGRR
jgi:hypothetical protein